MLPDIGFVGGEVLLKMYFIGVFNDGNVHLEHWHLSSKPSEVSKISTPVQRAAKRLTVDFRT